ncbi:MAG: anti-sigma factor [Pseudomonadota bacterium]|nr:anti-sigma factor [Pseudomonadota bacterium]
MRLLDRDELERALALAADDGEFQTEVARWNGHLASLLDEVEPIAPPASLLPEIERRIAEPPQRRDNVVQLHKRLNVWRGFAAGASAIAASLAVVLVTRPDPVVQPAPAPAPAPEEPMVEPGPRPAPAPTPAPAPEEPMVAMMASEETDATLIATWDRADRSLVVAAAAGMEPVSGQSHELWVIPADGVPRSMGLIPASGRMHLRVPGSLSTVLNEDATLAVSVEPSGGSPTGQPTGSVIASGKLERT